MADCAGNHCPESLSLILVVWGRGLCAKGGKPTPLLPEPSWVPDPGTDAEFTSTAEISSDRLPHIQAEELGSPFLALLGSSHSQVVERARKAFLCQEDEGFWWGRRLCFSAPTG